MKGTSDREDLLTRFLLGQVDEREQAEVEDQLLSDQEFFESAIAAEDDLMDAYVRGELSSSERIMFEETLLTSGPGRERVAFARGLAESTTRLHEAESAVLRSARPPTESSPRKSFLAHLFPLPTALNYALAGAAIIVVAVGVWLAVERMRKRIEPQQAQTESVAPHRPDARPEVGIPERGSGVPSPQGKDALPSPEPGGTTPESVSRPEPQTPATRPVFATVTLAPGSLRDGSAAGSLVIQRRTTHVRLLLEIERDDYESYRADVSTPEGRRVWAGAASKDRPTDARSVTMTLPAASLNRGDYVVELKGAVVGGRLEPAAEYSFRVTRQED